VFFGDVKFKDNRTVSLEGTDISAKRFIICTGSHPLIPPISGLSDVEYMTNENVFELEELPRSLAVLGGGPIGLELAQAFGLLGVKVTVVEMLDRLLFREDEEVANVLSEELKEEGVKILTGQKAVKFSWVANEIEISLEDKEGDHSTVSAEKVLVAVGRRPNVDGLDLEKAGVEYTQKGIKVDSTLRTSAKNIYACGDIAGPYQFSHMAEYQAIIALGNALMPFKRKIQYDSVPWCTFTDPELAHVGLTEEEAKNKYGRIKVYRSDYSANDRSVTDIGEKGFSKVICDKKGRILGAHIVGANAGEIIHEYVGAKSSKLKIGSLSAAIHVYPTLAQVVKRTADQSYTEMLGSKWFKLFTRGMLKLLK